jgi:hypothetical protein
LIVARLVVLKNPLSLNDREVFEIEAGSRVIDWLVEHYPQGCGGALRHFVNGKELPLDDLDREAEADDVIVLTINPAGLEPIYISLIISVALTAISMAAQLLFAKKPQAPAFAQADNAQASPVYAFRSNQNQARLGEPVPVVYGEVLNTPDVCAAPYRFSYEPTEEYTDLLLCLGQGEVQVSQILLGDTPIEQLDPGTVLYEVVRPVQHQQQMGNIATTWVPPFYENMISSPEVGDQDFINAGDTVGWYRLGKAGQQGRTLFFDFLFPSGLYQQMASSITSTSVTIRCSFVEVNEDGVPIGAPVDRDYQISTTSAGRNPARVTIVMDTGSVGSWAGRVTRQTVAEPNGNEVNRFQWTGLRMAVPYTADPVYGNVTLLAVRVRATQLTSAAERMIKVKMTRILPALGSGAAAPTISPADAFVDILTNTDYGAQRPVSEVDTTRLATLKAYWRDSYPYAFNAVFTGKTTVWEALTQCLQGVAATPLPVGGLMSVAQDGIKTSRVMLFSEQNIAKDSFKLSYQFDETGAPDGIEVEYRDPKTFASAYSRYPTASVDPEKVNLFGCTDKTHAEQMARLLWQRRRGNRRSVSFETEMEGLIPLPGDRVAVSHTLARWGMSGFVVGVSDDRTRIVVDRDLKWNEAPAPWIMAFRSAVGGISNTVNVTRGVSDREAILSADPWAGTAGDWTLNLEEEITHFTFGGGSRAVKDFILTSLSPKGGGQVSVGGGYYDPTVFENTLAFLALPVP